MPNRYEYRDIPPKTFKQMNKCWDKLEKGLESAIELIKVYGQSQETVQTLIQIHLTKTQPIVRR